MKKLIALMLALVMMFALVSCTGNGGEVAGDFDLGDASADVIPEGKQVPDDAVINVVTTSHASWPFKDDWAVWKYIREAVGGTINVNAYPGEDFATKYPLLMTSREDLPDIFAFSSKPGDLEDYAQQGAYLAIEDGGELMKDYNEFWDSVPADEQWMREIRRGPTGKTYYAPVYGMERSTNIRGWLYRKDIFEKHNLEVPTTLDELYEVSKKLKELYPESYPFCVRSGISNMAVIGPSFEEYFEPGPYYDYNAGEWKYGAREEVMYEVVEFFRKMVAEKLIPADFMTISSSTWQELVSTDRGFIMPEYQVRIDFFNNIARPNGYEEYTLAAMAPPVGPNGVSKVNKYNMDPTGYSVPNTGKPYAIRNAFRFLNWMYTDEAAELVSWGKEGETYNVVDGKREFIIEGAGETIKTLYGISANGSYLRMDPASVDLQSSAEQAATTDFMLEHTVAGLNPVLYLSYTPEEGALVADYTTQISSYVNENVQKFVIGQRPMSEWESFVEGLKDFPVDELLEVLGGAYDRVK